MGHYHLAFPQVRDNMWSKTFDPMAAIQFPRPGSQNRRRRVRQKVHAPAYATFHGGAKGQMLDLCEVLDISEIGVSVQSPSPMEANHQVNLCLDLAESDGQILTTASVVWSNSAGRVGLGFPPLGGMDLQRMRRWLFLNAMAGAANAASCAALDEDTERPLLRANFTDMLTAVSAAQREAESLNGNLEAVLSLIACRSQSLLQASGSAIALAGKTAGAMTCRASAGPSAPPVGATLQSGSGFSGDCVQSGKTQRCDDSETDSRVDPQSCRALGIRSMLASPVRSNDQVIGLIEVFSAQPNAFNEKDAVILQRFAETIQAAVSRAVAATGAPPPTKPFSPPAGSVLFAKLPKDDKDNAEKKAEEQNETKSESAQPGPGPDRDHFGGIRLPRTHLYLLIAAAATVALALGFILAPWIQEKINARLRIGDPTVLASSQPADAAPSVPPNPVDIANFQQLQQLAKQGNAAAENALGLLYAQGDDKQSIKPNEGEAATWFTEAAEHGSVPAQYKLSLLYWGGHGVPKDSNKAYFWAVLARAGGQEGSQDLAKVLANGMTRAQAAAIEQQAEIWYQQHESPAKPSAGH
jgi:hypothetical protein